VTAPITTGTRDDTDAIPSDAGDNEGGASSEVVPGPDAGITAVTRIAYVLFALQLVALCIWSSVLYSRFAVTHDGAEVLQILYQTAHGHLGAYSTIDRYPGWQDHFTLMYWPLAFISLIPPHGLLVMWLQDAAMVAAEVVAFFWIRDVVRGLRQRGELPAPWWPATLLGLGCFVLVANPWTYWALSWDIHTEPFAAPFIIAAAFDFSRGRHRRAWLWVLLTIVWGDVMATWVAGLGISALVAAVVSKPERRKHLRTAALLVATGFLWLAFATVLGGDKGSFVVASSGYVPGAAGTHASLVVRWSRLVTGTLGHPGTALRTLGGHWLNVSSVVGPAGWVGILTAWTFGVPFVIIIENNVSGFGSGVFSNPGYQSAPVFAFSAVGIVIIAAWAVRRWHVGVRGARVIAAVLALNCFVWAVIWIPQTKTDWLRISPSQAALLSRTLAAIPQADEVVASQGFVGRFADRADVYDLTGGSSSSIIPVTGSTVWFVVAPNVGIETQPVNGAQGAMADLAGLLQADLVSQRQGIWVFRWHRPADVHTLVFPGAVGTIPAWVAPGEAGRDQLQGPASNWSVVASGASGYVVSSDYWQRFAGNYKVAVRLTSTATTYVEVWDNNDRTLLAREAIPPTSEPLTVFFPLTVPPGPPGPRGYSGVAPFKVQRVPPVPGQSLEIRVWTAGGSSVRVYQLSLEKAQQALSTGG
jgi:hypothetical protein